MEAAVEAAPMAEHEEQLAESGKKAAPSGTPEEMPNPSSNADKVAPDSAATEEPPPPAEQPTSEVVDPTLVPTTQPEQLSGIEGPDEDTHGQGSQAQEASAPPPPSKAVSGPSNANEKMSVSKAKVGLLRTK